MAEDIIKDEPVVQNEDFDNDDLDKKSDVKSSDVIASTNEDKTKQQEVVPPPKEEMIPKSALKSLKERLDAAFAQRDEILKKLKTYEQKEAQERQKKLIEEGKVKEAYESQIQEFSSKLHSLESENEKLMRNIAIRDALKPYTFRNERAAHMTLKTLEDAFVKDENGQWLSAEGKTIDEAVKAFVESEENSFLFKRKEASGTGASGIVNTGNNAVPKHLSDMSTDEIISHYKKKLKG